MIWMLILTALLFLCIGFVAGCLWNAMPMDDDQPEPPLGIG